MRLKLAGALLLASVLAISTAAVWQQPLFVTGGVSPGDVPLFVTANQVGRSGLLVDANNNLVLKMYEAPPGAASVALAGAGAGNVTNGVHKVVVTITTAAGESLPGTQSAGVTVADNTTNGQVSITAIPLAPDIFGTGRKVYMTLAGGSTFFLLSNGTIANNTATTLTANDSDATLAAAALAPVQSTAFDTRMTIGNNGAQTYPGAFDAYQSVQVVCPTASVLALNTTPFQLVAAPGSGKAIIVDRIVAKIVFNSVAYTGANACTFRYTNGSGAQVTATMAAAFINTGSGTALDYMPAVSAETTPVANAAIVAFVGTANPGAGNSPITFTVLYHVVTA